MPLFQNEFSCKTRRGKVFSYELMVEAKDNSKMAYYNPFLYFASMKIRLGTLRTSRSTFDGAWSVPVFIFAMNVYVPKNRDI